MQAQRRHGPRRVAVVGAGITGLAAAWRLVTGPQPVQVTVLEAGEQVGGKLRVAQLDGLGVDVGAEAMLARRPEAVGLVGEIGLGPDLVYPATTAAGVVRGGIVYPLPAGTVMGVPTDPYRLSGLLTGDEVARVLAEPGRPAPPLEADVDVASWVAGRFGSAVVDHLVEPLLGGVYAGKASRLSLQATVPRLWALAHRGGSVLEGLSRLAQPPQPRPAALPSGGVPAAAPSPPPLFAGVRGGVGRLPLELARRLAGCGVEIRTGSAVRQVRRSVTGWRLVLGRADRQQTLDVDAVLLAVPPSPAACLLRDIVPAAAAALTGVPTASMVVVAMLLPRKAMDGVTGSGVLVPPVEGRVMKAATYSSVKWAWTGALHPDLVVVRVSLGRLGEETVLRRDDADLVDVSVAELSGLLARSLCPVASLVTRWGDSLPQYAVGHVDRVAGIREAVSAVPGLAVAGAAYDGVGIAACIASAWRAVAELGSQGRIPA